MQPAMRAFGLSLLADMPPPGAWAASAPPAEAASPAKPILHLRTTSAAEIAEHWSGPAAIGWEGTIDGAPFLVERGLVGDHRFVHGELPDQRGTPAAGTRAIHHLSADAGTLRCAPADPTEQSWWRVVLDSALFTVALLQGYEALHAGAIATPGGAIAIAAATGGGKSTLLNELLSDGWGLMTDDVLVLESRGEDAPLAYPGAPLMTVPTSISPLPGALIASVDGTSVDDTSVDDASVDGAPVGEERWIAVRAHQEAIPLSALVVLNRGPGLATSLHPARDPLAMLMGSLLRFPRVPERERTRFEMAAAIAAHVPIWELSADPGVTPGTLARTLRTGLIEAPEPPLESPPTFT
jgi:hypothetical protein